MNLSGPNLPDKFIIRIVNSNYTVYTQDVDKLDVHYIEEVKRYDEQGESAYTKYGVTLLMKDERKIEGDIFM